MKFIQQFVVIGCTVSLFSCTKEDKKSDPVKPQNPQKVGEYSNLKIGNYWVYELYDVDSNDNAISRSEFDTVSVEKDTVIRGNRFYKLTASNQLAYDRSVGVSYRRDSLDYVVTSDGFMVFSHKDFQNIFYTHYAIVSNDTIYKMESKMTDHGWLTTTSMGNFITSNYKTEIEIYPPYVQNMQKRNLNVRYAHKVGIVQESLPFYIGIPSQVERRLVKYYVQK